MADRGDGAGMGDGEDEQIHSAAEAERPYARLSLRVQIVGVVLLFLSLVALLVSIGTRVRQTEYTACQSAVTDQYIAAANARSEAAGADRALDRQEISLLFELLDTQVDFINAVIGSKSADEVLEAFKRYNVAVGESDRRRAEIATKRADNERERREHPLPAPPSQTCA